MADFIKILDKPALYEAADTDNIKAVVGGVNTDHFAPSANISFKMQSGVEQYFFNICDDADQVKTVDKAETLDGDKLAIKDGDIESTFTLSETSLKIERVFSTKPTTAPKYKLAFSQGVQFFYQGELTPEEIADGCSRPDNVVGSYAVYCDKQGHFKNPDGSTKVNYGCGKIGHLYAPYWTDSSGKKIKGTQEIQGNILTFALPPHEWIDSAVLPITLDPDVGYAEIGGSTYSLSADRRTALISTGTTSGEVQKMFVYWKCSASAGRAVAMGLFTDDSGTPDSLVIGEEKSSQQANTWEDLEEFDVSGDAYSVTASTDYHIGLQGYDESWGTPGYGVTLYYDSVTPADNHYSAWADPWGTITWYASGLDYRYSSYIQIADSGILPIKMTPNYYQKLLQGAV